MRESWLEVPGNSGYWISSKGRLKSTKEGAAKLKRSWRLPRGYICYKLCKNGKPANFLAHRLVLEAFRGASDGRHVHHINHKRDDNRLENLCWVSPKENEQFKKNAGRNAFGERHGMSKLTGPKILKIRKMWGRKISMRKIALTFGVAPSTIAWIIQGKHWTHI